MAFICFKVFSCDLRVLWLDRLAFCYSDCDETTASPLISTTPSLQLPLLRAQSRSLLGSGDEAYLNSASSLLPFKYSMPLLKRSLPQCMPNGFPACPGKEWEGNPISPEVVTLFAFQGTHFSWLTKRPVVWWGVAEVTKTSSLRAYNVCPWEPNLFPSACTMASP